MPITADMGGKEYTLGRGRVYIDLYAQNATITSSTLGEGERYFGNSPAASITTTSENLEHFDADSGVKNKDFAVQLSVTRNGTLTVDNLTGDNLAAYFLGDKSTVTQTALTAQTMQRTVKQDRFYQLGVTTANPTGVRSVSNVVVAKGAGFSTNVTAAGNWEVDEALGRIRILAGAPDIADDTEIRVTYDVAAGTREQVISKSNSIYAAIRFVADNPAGKNRDYYMPYVKLSPDGDYQLKGETILQMNFTMELLKKGSLESLYIDGRPA